MKRLTKTLEKFTPIVTIFVIIALWWAFSAKINAEIILPDPKLTLKAFGSLIKENTFWRSVGESLKRVFISFSLALVSAIVFALCSSTLKFFEKLFYPLVVVVRATPTMSVIFLCIIWFKPTISPMFVAFLVLFPTLYASVLSAVKDSDKNIVEMSKIYKVPKLKQIFEFYLPSVASRVYSDAINAISLNVKLIIAAEALSQTRFSLGGGMQIARLNLETAQLFAYTVAAVILSYLLELLLRLVRILFRRICDARAEKYC